MNDRVGPALSLGSRGVALEVLRLTWPAVMTGLLQTGVFLADRLLLGRYGRDALASMQVQGPLLWSLFSVFGGVLVGAVPLVARSLGAGSSERAEAAARAAVRLAFGLGVVVAVGCIVALDPIISAIGPSSLHLRELSKRYVFVALLGFPQMFVATTLALISSAAGNTRTPFLVGLLTNLVNVIANVVLIFGADLGPLGRIPALGVTGSASGSVIAFSLEALLLLWALSRPSSSLRVGGPWLGTNDRQRSAQRDLLRLGGPALAERLVIHAGFLAFTGVITRLGELAMASNQALITLESICFLSADGFGIAAAAVVGQSLGQGSPSRARRAGWLATSLCVLALSLLGLIIWALGPGLLGLFVPRGQDGRELLASGMTALPLLALSQPFMATSIVLGQALRGAGDTRSPLIAALVGGAAIRVGAAYWLGVSQGLGVRGIWIASALDWAVRTGILSAIFARGRWTQARV